MTYFEVCNIIRYTIFYKFPTQSDEKSYREQKEDEEYNVYCIWGICIIVIYDNKDKSKLCKWMINDR